MNGFRPASLLAAVKKLQRVNARKRAVESWIETAVAGDAVLGRSAANWAADPARGIKAFLPQFKAKGIAAYVGSGQLILVDFKPNAPLIMQRRPLAQREVVIDLTGGTPT